MAHTAAGFIGHMGPTDSAIHRTAEPSPRPPVGEVRRDLAFVPADPRHRLRTRLGAWLLVTAAPRLMSHLSRVVGPAMTRRLERRWADAITRLLRVDVDISGLGNVDPAAQYLVMPLHEGFGDIPALLRLPLDLRFTVRDELLDLPGIGRYLATTGQIPVVESPSRADLRALYADVERALAAGDSVVLFPQGSILGIEIAFRQGIFRLAKRFGIPVLPVVIAGTHRVWEHPYAPTVRLDQAVSMDVLAPIPPTQLSAERIRQTERTMKSQALVNPDTPARRFDPERDGWWDDYRYEIDPDFTELHERVARHRSAMGLR